MKGGRATAEQTARAITGAFVWIPFTEISRSIKLIQGEINKGKGLSKDSEDNDNIYDFSAFDIRSSGF